MDEMEISENGPFEFRAGKLLIVKMDKYWRKETKSDTFDILDTFSSRKKWKNFTKYSYTSVKIQHCLYIASLLMLLLVLNLNTDIFTSDTFLPFFRVDGQVSVVVI